MKLRTVIKSYLGLFFSRLNAHSSSKLSLKVLSPKPLIICVALCCLCLCCSAQAKTVVSESYMTSADSAISYSAIPYRNK